MSVCVCVCMGEIFHKQTTTTTTLYILPRPTISNILNVDCLFFFFEEKRWKNLFGKQHRQTLYFCLQLFLFFSWFFPVVVVVKFFRGGTRHGTDKWHWPDHPGPVLYPAAFGIVWRGSCVLSLFSNLSIAGVKQTARDVISPTRYSFLFYKKDWTQHIDI